MDKVGSRTSPPEAYAREGLSGATLTLARAAVESGALESRLELDPAKASPGVRAAYEALASSAGIANARLTQFSIGRHRPVLLSAISSNHRTVIQLLGPDGKVLAKGSRPLHAVTWDTALGADDILPALKTKVAADDGSDWVPAEPADLPEAAQDLLVAMQEDDSVDGVEAFTVLQNDRTFFLVAARDDGNQDLYRVFSPDGGLYLSGKRTHAELEWEGAAPRRRDASRRA